MFCKWCDRAIPVLIDGKKSTQRMWHPDCAHEFNLHTRPDQQFMHLVRRDGRVCQTCRQNPIDYILEVDHRVPLWSVAHLPDEERRWYFGPGNLWLLCTRCHALKTRREAGERAAERSFTKAQMILPL